MEGARHCNPGPRRCGGLSAGKHVPRDDCCGMLGNGAMRLQLEALQCRVKLSFSLTWHCGDLWPVHGIDRLG